MRLENHTCLPFTYKGQEYQPVLPFPLLKARPNKSVDITCFAEGMEITGEPAVKEGAMHIVPPSIALLLWMRGRNDILTVAGWASTDWLDSTPKIETLIGAENRIFESLEPPQDRFEINDEWNRLHPPVQAKD